MPVTSNVDPAKIIINCGGANINGFADGTFVNFELDEDEYNTTTGADGFVTRTKTNNRSGVLTITLLQSSPSNNILQGLYDLDRSTPAGSPFPVIVKNLLNLELVTSSAAWVQKLPAIEYSKEITNREWMIKVADAIVTVAGNAIFQG